MKIFPTTILILAAGIGARGQSKAGFGQYHIRVECYYEIAGDQYYHVTFTANNWASHDELHNSDEITNYATNDIDDYGQYKDVDYTPLLSTDKYRLIDVARNLKTLQSAKRFEDSVLNRYRIRHAYFMKIKPNFKPIYHKPIKKKCCKMTNVY